MVDQKHPFNVPEEPGIVSSMASLTWVAIGVFDKVWIAQKGEGGVFGLQGETLAEQHELSVL